MMPGRVVISSHQGKGERGSILALTAVCLLALLLALALCLDISHFYSVQTELQNAADAAALTGASALTYSQPTPPWGVNTLAQTLALAQMNKYEFNKNSINFSQPNLYFASNFDALQTFLYSNSSCAAIAGTATPANVERAGETKLNAAQVAFVGVCMPAPQNTPLFFAQLATSQTVLIRGRAIAGNSPPLTAVCDSVAPMALVDDPNIANSTEYPPGAVLTLQKVSQNSGQYGLIDLCAGDDTEALQSNCAGCLSVGSIVHPMTSDEENSASQGLNARFDADVVVSDGISYSQYQQQYRDYLQNGTPPPGANINSSGTFGRRVLVVPAVNKNDVFSCEDEGDECNWRVTDFLAFFIQKRVSGEGDDEDEGGAVITAEFIGRLPVANGTYYPGTPITRLTKTVLYR